MHRSTHPFSESRTLASGERARSSDQIASKIGGPCGPGSELVAVALLLALALGGLDADLLVIFLHARTNVPVDEGTLRIHQVELVVDARENFSNRGGIGNHAAGAHHLGQVAARDHGGRLVIDATLET